MRRFALVIIQDKTFHLLQFIIPFRRVRRFNAKPVFFHARSRSDAGSWVESEGLSCSSHVEIAGTHRGNPIACCELWEWL